MEKARDRQLRASTMNNHGAHKRSNVQVGRLSSQPNDGHALHQSVTIMATHDVTHEHPAHDTHEMDPHASEPIADTTTMGKINPESPNRIEQNGSSETRAVELKMCTMQRIHDHNRRDIGRIPASLAEKYGVAIPEAVSTGADLIDDDQVTFFTQLALRSGASLPDFVRMVRGQTSADPRPNKDLFELQKPPDSHMHGIYKQWNRIVQEGVRPRWNELKPDRQTVRPSNHLSASTQPQLVQHQLRKGQLDGRYLIVDSVLLSNWPEIFVSPLGAIEKSGSAGSEVRLINDYSYPPDASVNDFTERENFPDLKYNPPRDIARELARLRRVHPHETVLIMVGDVAGAFRHVSLHAEAVHMFAFVIDNYIVIDLACGFGWCGSPAFYGLAGSIINYMYEHQGNAIERKFVGNYWCDDRTCCEIDTGTRCRDANLQLRLAMATVLGITAINERKFTEWGTRNKSLGLVWNTERGTVSIPIEKVEEARKLVIKAINDPRLTKSGVQSLIGRLRHIASCFRPARGFFQRLHSATAKWPSVGYRRLPVAATEDLHWFRAVLDNSNRFNSIPFDHFADLAAPAVHIYMDASDSGLCALYPAQRKFLRSQFSKDEVILINERSAACSINVRELRSGVLAALTWGKEWQDITAATPVHVRFHIDNVSAVSWVNRRASTNPTARLYNRIISLIEFRHNIICTAEHIPGELNSMADAGSRAWDPSHPLAEKWTNFSQSWTQERLEPQLNNLSDVWDRYCAVELWQAPRIQSIDSIGNNGNSSQAK